MKQDMFPDDLPCETLRIITLNEIVHDHEYTDDNTAGVANTLRKIGDTLDILSMHDMCMCGRPREHGSSPPCIDAAYGCDPRERQRCSSSRANK